MAAGSSPQAAQVCTLAVCDHILTLSEYEHTVHVQYVLSGCVGSHTPTHIYEYEPFSLTFPYSSSSPRRMTKHIQSSETAFIWINVTVLHILFILLALHTQKEDRNELKITDKHP